MPRQQVLQNCTMGMKECQLCTKSWLETIPSAQRPPPRPTPGWTQGAPDINRKQRLSDQTQAPPHTHWLPQPQGHCLTTWVEGVLVRCSATPNACTSVPPFLGSWWVELGSKAASLLPLLSGHWPFKAAGCQGLSRGDPKGRVWSGTRGPFSCCCHLRLRAAHGQA